MNLLKKNIFKNGIATALQKMVAVGEQLLLVPFFINAWGVEYYGEWITLTIIPTVLSFSNFGFGTAASNSFVLNYVAGKVQVAANYFKTGFIIISGSIIFGFILTAFVLYILDLLDVFNKSLILRNDAILAVTLLIVARLFNFYNQLFTAHFIAVRKAALSINLLTINKGLILTGSLIVLLLGYGIVEFACVQLITILIFNVFYGLKGHKMLTFDDTLQSKYIRSYSREIIRKGFGFLMAPIWQVIYFQGTIFVVRIVLGAEAVVVFSTVRKLTRTINQIFIMINGTVFPELQYELGKGNIIKAQNLFKTSILVVFIIAFLGVLFLGVFGLWFYEIWTSNQLEVPIIMWYVFIVGILFNALWWTSGMVFRALNKPRYFAKLGVISAFISVIVSYMLSVPYGLNGVAMGTLVLELIMAIFLLPKACKLMGIQSREIIKDGTEYLKKLPHIFLQHKR